MGRSLLKDQNETLGLVLILCKGRSVKLKRIGNRYSFRKKFKHRSWKQKKKQINNNKWNSACS